MMKLSRMMDTFSIQEAVGCVKTEAKGKDKRAKKAKTDKRI